MDGRNALVLLVIVCGVTVGAWVASEIARGIHRVRLRRLALKWRMGYAQEDLFNLAARILPQFPIPAAGDLRIIDLLHHSEGRCHRYLFTAEYTCGVISGHRRERRVLTFCEPRDHARGCPAPLVAAPEHLTILDQYAHLHERGTG